MSYKSRSRTAGIALPSSVVDETANNVRRSPSLLPTPKDWPQHISVGGFCRVPTSSYYQPPDDLVRFLEEGAEPIYIGFGSIVVDDTAALTSLIYETISRLGKRAVIGRGWSNIGDSPLMDNDPQIFQIDNCPHEWLFQHVSCVVHHGGAGTTVAGIAAGKPTVVVPFFGDQFFWGNVVGRTGAGPSSLPFKQLTVEKLADRITTALSQSCVAVAQCLARKLAAEDGAQGFLTAFHASLPLDDMTCALCPDRVAVWRYRRSKMTMRLSSFAATVLREAGLVSSKELFL